MSWIDGLPPRPLCDVPWHGNTMVLSTGEVQMCCFSTAVVGNVKDQPFAAIWNGEAMQRIRASLRRHEFPPECRTPSCPIHRGDAVNYIRERTEGLLRGEARDSDNALRRARFAGTALELEPRASARDAVAVRLDVRYAGPPCRADVFVGVRLPDGSRRFLPELDDVPVPLGVGVPYEGPRSHPILAWEPATGRQAGDYELCAALFVPGSDPNSLANCDWAGTVTFAIAAG